MNKDTNKITLGVIPARMGSSRFPGKPMKPLHGIPMIGHCIYRASRCDKLDDVVVATCDQEIFDYVQSIGCKAIMTSDSHERASDRVAEAMLKYEEDFQKSVEICVLLQGDEPMSEPSTIGMAVDAIQSDKSIKVVNVYSEIEDDEEFLDHNVVKVVPTANQNACYFSREPIPSAALAKSSYKKYKQICIIPFRRNYLLDYTNLEPTANEIIESIDMNRVLDHEEKVHLVYSNAPNYAVDTPEDLLKVENLMSGDKLLADYSKQ
ncbi:MAG: 3-deoxy-manno-octulosonate cytidylyltransferase [Schleiferiaceae bacterium]|nr:3-deoxy-manno-octulosonate cytidylyltransferase [Schleiferiaceae bacterium]